MDLYLLLGLQALGILAAALERRGRGELTDEEIEAVFAQVTSDLATDRKRLQDEINKRKGAPT